MQKVTHLEQTNKYIYVDEIVQNRQFFNKNVLHDAFLMQL